MRLEYLRVGGTNCTSMEALARFFARLGGEEPPGTPGTPRKLDSPNTRTQTTLVNASGRAGGTSSSVTAHLNIRTTDFIRLFT